MYRCAELVLLLLLLLLLLLAELLEKEEPFGMLDVLLAVCWLEVVAAAAVAAVGLLF